MRKIEQQTVLLSMEACQQEVERLAQNEHKRGVDQHNLQSRGNLLDKVNAEIRMETEGEPAVEALAVPVLSQKMPRSLQSEAGGEDRHGLKNSTATARTASSRREMGLQEDSLQELTMEPVLPPKVARQSVQNGSTSET